MTPCGTRAQNVALAGIVRTRPSRFSFLEP